ncbi:MOSC domain-containing protein [Azospirillum sp.]|uniref:MOSC domain-containing protein n=1 Tax=Azospirillum sp. TaxID=34012 RepID=UPI002D38A3D2|nr:MOSC domain-containing protein [Azospirillum sp.]HYD68669.1 MOSC domain-containing protein [Azospirillum sp.]
MPITLAKIFRYPVKGLTAQELPAAELTAGQALPGDRRYALLHGAATLEAGHHEEGWRPKSDFLQLARHEKLAALETEFDEDTQTLVIYRGGRPVSRGRLDQPMGRMLVEQFFAAYMAGSAPGAPKLAEAKGFAYTDTDTPFVSLLNLASVHDIERVAKQPVDPTRFRGNLWLDGLDPWEERNWGGRTLTVGGTGGGATLEVVRPIGRCAATEVNPGTGARDLNVLRTLRDGFGHTHCGVYARVVGGGRIAAGDPVTLTE